MKIKTKKKGVPTQQVCFGCAKVKMCRLFVLQDGEAEFICEDCRNEKS